MLSKHIFFFFDDFSRTQNIWGQNSFFLVKLVLIKMQANMLHGGVDSKFNTYQQQKKKKDGLVSRRWKKNP